MKYKKTWHKNAILFWQKITGQYTVADELYSVLFVACQALDVYSRGMDTLFTEGLTYNSKGGDIKNHPANEVCSKSLNGFLRAIRMLGITTDDEAAAVGIRKVGKS